MIPTISPKDIQSPLGVIKPYEGVARDSKEGMVLTVLVHSSQQDGKWKTTNNFPPEYNSVLNCMERRGTIRKINEGYILSQKTVEALAESYPSK